MDEYKTPYLILFNSITDALAMLERQNYGTVKELLIKAQKDAETAFVDEASV